MEIWEENEDEQMGGDERFVFLLFFFRVFFSLCVLFSVRSCASFDIPSFVVVVLQNYGGIFLFLLGERASLGFNIEAWNFSPL